MDPLNEPTPTASAPPAPLPPLDSELARTLREHGVGKVVLRRFCLERELGAGGMGVVWLGKDQLLNDRLTALKFLPGLIVRDVEAIADLRREIEHGLDCGHPGVVRVYDLHVSLEERIAAIAMEYVDGKTLSELKSETPGSCFEPEATRPWLRQLCEVLTYLHDEAGMVHRDLKPRNLMLNQRGRLKLADFGISAAITESHSRVSGIMGLSGTPCYMSPQQSRGHYPRPSDDIYALGATLYELLTGKPPFYRGSPAIILQQLRDETPPPMAQRRQELGVRDRAPLPAIWEETVAACLAKEPDDRPPTATAVLDCLGHSLESGAASQSHHANTPSPTAFPLRKSKASIRVVPPKAPRPPAPAEAKSASAQSPSIGRNLVTVLTVIFAAFVAALLAFDWHDVRTTAERRAKAAAIPAPQPSAPPQVIATPRRPEPPATAPAPVAVYQPTPTPWPEPPVPLGGIFSDSSRRYLKRSELTGLSTDTLWLARNEIYARHGLIFVTERGRSFARALGSAYHPVTTSQTTVEEHFNDYEKENVLLLKKLEGL